MIVSAITAVLSTALVSALGLVLWKHIEPLLKVIILYSLFSLISDTVSIYLVLRNHHNIVVISLFAVGQLGILGLYFTKLLKGKFFERTSLVLYSATLLALICYSFIFNDPTNYVIALRSTGIGEIIIVALCIVSFYNYMLRLPVARIELYAHFWIISGLLLHMTSSVILTFSSEIISNTVFSKLWEYFKNLMQIVMNLLFMLGIYLSARNKAT